MAGGASNKDDRMGYQSSVCYENPNGLKLGSGSKDKGSAPCKAYVIGFSCLRLF